MLFSRNNKLFFFILLWLNVAFSQNYPSKNYTTATKLPNNSIRSLLVDSNNILWIGTENGVVKKENDVFNYFFEEDGLALNSCWAIAEDKNNNLWFGSYGKGISIYDGANFKVISEKDGLAHNEITKLYAHRDYMFVGTSDGVSVIDLNTFKVRTLEIANKDELFRVQDFFEYQEDIYVVTYRSGIYKFELKNDKASLSKITDHKNLYSVFTKNDSIYSSNKGFVTKANLVDYLENDNATAHITFGQSIIWDYIATKNEKVFVAAWGIFDNSGGIYEIKNDELISRASDFNVPSVEVLSLAYDELFEKLYVGTKNAGVFEVKLKSPTKFKTIPEKNVLSFARTKTTSAILLNDALLLKNNNKEVKIGLDRLKSWQENYVSTTQIPLPKHEDDFYELQYGMPAQHIGFYDLKVFKDTYWLNTNIGVFAISEAGKLKRYIPLHTEEINFSPNGNLIEFHPYSGARVYNDLDKFKYTYLPKENPNTPTMVVNSLKQPTKTYFTSVFSGLYVSSNKGFKSYLQEGIWDEEKLRHITSLGSDLAISTDFGDVYIVNDQTDFKIIEKLPRAKIEGNSISFLKEYKGTLIIGTEKGLTLFKDKRYIYLNEEQGLKQPLLSAEVVDDTLSIGSENGFYTINLETVSNSTALVKELKLKEIYINNSEVSTGTITEKDNLTLAYNENTLLLKFSTNAHPNPNKLYYQYRLNPNEKWSLSSPKPDIFIPFLPSNEYKIEVKVLDKSTGLFYTQSLLNLTILNPYWKTWWFLLMILGAILLVVYGFYKYEIRQTKKFEEQKSFIQKRFEETKMEALLAQMNPHFIFNAMNSIQNYIMDSDIDNASIFLGDFAKLIRLNLDHCTKPTILLVEEIEYLQSYIRVENTRFNNSVKVVIDTDPAIDPYETEIPTMLLQTFVENVFVHAFPDSITNPTLTVSFKLLANNVLECNIKDNGIGFTSTNTNNLHTSKGVSLVKERLALLGYHVEDALEILSFKNKGTSVVITLKV